MQRIYSEKLDASEMLASFKNTSAGAVVLFSGETRDHNEGKKVSYLEYEAYEVMADKSISKILEDAIEKWNLHYADCWHRVGRVDLSEPAVLVLTGSSHRAEAYAANRYIINRVKEESPIWKREFFADGSTRWGKNCDHEHHAMEGVHHSAE